MATVVTHHMGCQETGSQFMTFSSRMLELMTYSLIMVPHHTGCVVVGANILAWAREPHKTYFIEAWFPGDRAHRNITLNHAMRMFSWQMGSRCMDMSMAFTLTFWSLKLPGDDTLGLWGVGGSNTPLTNVHFSNFYSHDAGYPNTTGACMKAFGTGPNIS